MKYLIISIISAILLISLLVGSLVHYRAYEDCNTAKSMMDNNLFDFNCNFIDNKVIQHSWYVDGKITSFNKSSTIDFDKVEWGRLI